MTDDPAAAGETTSWRELAVSRSLDAARGRAEVRVQRFLDAATDLMSDSPEKDFTVQEVVERSGQSLRSFYQYFNGKHELLLALFEEAVRSTAAHLTQVVAEEDEPLQRLHRFTVEYYHLCQPRQGRGREAAVPIPALAEFAQTLLTEHPKEAAQAFIPLVSLLEGLLDEAADAGAVRPRLGHRRIVGVVLQAIMFNAFATTIAGASPEDEETDGAEEMWELALHGLGTPA
jgi:AcrR family transcriptional regulator